MMIPERDLSHYRKGPWILLLWGAPAAGKTTLARSLLNSWSPHFIVPHLSSDQVNRALIGEAFQRQLRPVIYQGLLTMAGALLRQGQGLVLDGTFLELDARQQVRTLCESLGAVCLSVQVTCPLALRLQRNSARAETQRVPDEWVRQAHYKAGFGSKDASLVVDTSELLAEEARDRVLAALLGRLRRAHGMMLKQAVTF